MPVTQDQLAGVQFELGELKTAVIRLDNRASRLKNKIGWSEAELRVSRPAFGELKTRVGGMSDTLGAMRTEVFGMQVRMSVFQTVVPRSETDGLKTVLAETNAKIAEMNGAISQIVLRIAEANKHIDELIHTYRRIESQNRRIDAQFAHMITRLDIIIGAVMVETLAIVGLTIYVAVGI